MTLIFLNRTLAFIAWIILSDAPFCFLIPLCSYRLSLSKSLLLLCHWSVPPCYVYSIAHSFPKCNTQNEQTSQNVFVQDAEFWRVFLFLLQLTKKCAIMEDVVVSLSVGDGTRPFFFESDRQTTYAGRPKLLNIRHFIY